MPKDEIKSEDELASSCLRSRDPDFHRFLSGLSDEEKRQAIKKAIRDHGIKKDPISQTFRQFRIFELYQFIAKEYQEENGELMESKEDLFNNYPSLNNFPAIASNDWQQKRFLLLTRSEQFQAEIERIRKYHGIPQRGFSQDNRDYEKWRSSRTDSQMRKLDEALETLISRKYKIPFFPAAFWYLMYDLKFWRPIPEPSRELPLAHKRAESSSLKKLAVIEHFPEKDQHEADYLKERGVDSPIDILTSDLLIRLHNANTSKNPLDSFSASLKDLFLVAIKRPVSEKELVAFVRKHNRFIKKEMNSFFGTISTSKDFHRDLAIYDLHRAGKRDREIREMIKQSKFGNLSASTIKKSWQRFNKRVKDIEKTGTRK